MKRAFVKMQGCGNDYIYFDCFKEALADPGPLSVRLSDRHFGIGGDGVVTMEASPVADARMRMFNADGSEGEMCGNAIRCVGKYIYESGRARRGEVTVETRSGIKALQLTVRCGQVVSARVNMGKAELAPGRIPVDLPGERAVGVALWAAGRQWAVTCVSMGNPHCVVFVDDPDGLDLPLIGPQFERHPLFPQRVNTEFVAVQDSHTLRMRVWERGSGETLACGTGACAAAVAAVLNGHCPAGEPVTVRLRGGDLVIEVLADSVYMSGGAEKVFEGEVEV